jgi:spermidine/putrescine transport system ATP-binding protein
MLRPSGVVPVRPIVLFLPRCRGPRIPTVREEGSAHGLPHHPARCHSAFEVPRLSAPVGARTAVSLRGVSKVFPGMRGGDEVAAVDALDLDIADGEFFSLLGPSGCGKTTTLRIIAGLEFPSAGSVRIFDAEVGLEPPDKRPVNTVFQSYALFPHMTVAKNIAFGLEMRDVPRDEIQRRVGEAIELVRLSGREERMPSELSGGQQQRVALARALVNRPKVLLLDEPLGALDLKLRQAMQLELKQLQEHVGITFIYVTHDQEEALAMSDRLGVMDGGRLVQVGTPGDVYERPTTRFVAGFLGESNIITATVIDAEHVRLPSGDVARVATDRAVGAEVTLALRPEQLDLRHVEAQRDLHLDALHGTVSKAFYMGSAIWYDVIVDGTDGQMIEVRQNNNPGIEHYDTGERVRVRWNPRSATALED